MFEIIHENMDFSDYYMIYLYRIIIKIYRDYFAFYVINFNNFLLKSSNLINNLYISIVNYETIYIYIKKILK